MRWPIWQISGFEIGGLGSSVIKNHQVHYWCLVHIKSDSVAMPFVFPWNVCLYEYLNEVIHLSLVQESNLPDQSLLTNLLNDSQTISNCQLHSSSLPLKFIPSIYGSESAKRWENSASRTFLLYLKNIYSNIIRNFCTLRNIGILCRTIFNNNNWSQEAKPYSIGYATYFKS